MINNQILENIFEKAYTRYELKKFITNELLKAVNEEHWITIKGKHILLKDNDTPYKALKRIEIKSALYAVVEGKKDEITIQNVRSDLAQYGGNNNISIIKGNIKGGAAHILDKHSGDIEGIIDTILNGKITNVIKERKVFLETDNYLVILQLDYFGNKKTWLLTGYEKEELKKDR